MKASKILELTTKIKELLILCAEPQQLMFKRMYSAKNLELPLNEVVDNMENDRLEWALSQIETTIKNNQKKLTTDKMNITDDNTIAVEKKNLFSVLEAAKTEGIKAYRINEDNEIFPSLSDRKKLTELGYKLTYGQYETENGEMGFFTMVFFYPPKVNPVKTNTLTVELEIDYTSASFKLNEVKKSLKETFNTWGVSGYQIKTIKEL